MSPSSDAPGAPVIQRRNLVEEVYRVLWGRIVSRDLHPGQKLSDLRISTELGVSRTPVREALHRLLQDGVIEAQPNRGFYVTSFAAADIDEIFEIRAALEALALRSLALHHPEEDYAWALAQLDEVEAQIAGADDEAAIVAANDRFLEVDQRFHRYLVENSGNGRLIGLVNGIWAQIAVFQKAGSYVPGYVQVALHQHRQIIGHLHDGRHTEAIDALQDHIRDMKTRIIADVVGEPAQETVA